MLVSDGEGVFCNVRSTPWYREAKESYLEVHERTNNENNGTPARQFEKESRDFVIADVKFRWTELSFRISRITSQDFFLPLWFRKIREPVTEGGGGEKRGWRKRDAKEVPGVIHIFREQGWPVAILPRVFFPRFMFARATV